ncbi:MAG: hypothetical protein KBC73_08990 [Burkholderiaceae bacterium]|nr:hypothetical protein [Burkholderiaceae bacterium]
MTPLSDIDLVALATGCEAGPPVDAALRALALAWPDVPPARWPALDAGRRDALLLQLRRRHFGDWLHAESVCPACGERLEFELSATALIGAQPAVDPAHDGPPLAVRLQGQSRQLRRPSTADLLAARDATDLARRCALEAPAGDLAWCSDPAWLQAFGEALAADAPLADAQLALVCPACSSSWEETLDAAVFLVQDLQAAGRRLLDEVHVLALAYHWSERDILALPAERRRHYLGRLTS